MAIARWVRAGMLALIAAALSAGQQPGTAPAAPRDFSLVALARQFDYDAKAPLEVQSKVLEERDGATVYDVSYASPQGGRVTAFLVAPAGKGPFAGILFGHWGPGDRSEFLPEAVLYARAGAVSLLVDYPWVRPAPWHRALKFFEDPEWDRQLYIQAVVDLRRGLDLLLARSNVDAKRIGYVGHSYGAQWGAILSAVDKRMKTAVLMGGTPDRAAIWLEADDPDLVEFRKPNMEKIKKYLELDSAIDAVRYVPYAAPIPLLFQFAVYEQNFERPAMERYFAAASQPKQVRWYSTGHDLNDPQTLVDRAAWLQQHLGIAAVRWPSTSR